MVSLRNVFSYLDSGSQMAINQIQLNLLIDTNRNRVLYAECDKDFVNVLFSFLMLPMGGIIMLSDNGSGIGSMDELYRSIVTLDTDYFCTKSCQRMLLKPRRASKFQFDNVNLRSKNFKCFVKIERRFMVTDDFQVVPAEIDSVKSLLIGQGIRDNTGVLQRPVTLDLQEVLTLLHRSLLSKTPLTDFFLPGITNINTVPPLDSLLRNSQSHTQGSGNRSSRYKDINAKLWFRRSTETVICVEAKGDFVDFLFSLLTLSLASVIERLKGKSRLGSIDNLYRSAQNLSSKDIVFKRSMEMILNPKIEGMFLCRNNLLGIPEPEDSLYSIVNACGNRYDRYSYRCRDLSCKTGFVKWERCFFVTDRLGVVPQSPISFISGLNIPFADLDHRQIRVEKKEAIALLKAALTSTTALNQAFRSQVANR